MSDTENSSTSLDLIDPQSATTNLRALGLSPETIAAALSISVSEVRAYLTSGIVNYEEEILAEKVRRLTDLALSHAFRILESGPSEQRLMIIRSLVGNTGRLIGRGEGGSTEEARAALEQLMSNLRDVPKLTTVVTEEEIIEVEEDDAPVTTSHRTTLHQDEEAGDEEVRFGLR